MEVGKTNLEILVKELRESPPKNMMYRVQSSLSCHELGHSSYNQEIEFWLPPIIEEAIIEKRRVNKDSPPSYRLRVWSTKGFFVCESSEQQEELKKMYDDLFSKSVASFVFDKEMT